MIEVGRFCLAPGLRDPDILRVAWGAMTALVDHSGATLLFGCTSFAGTSPEPYAEAFAFIAQHHKAPPRWRPEPRARLTVQLEERQQVEATAALRTMPALLRSYLTMGGWVSDHAVVDPEMNTLHVFTAVEVAAIPTERKKLLRALC